MFFSNQEGIILEFLGIWHLIQIALSALVIFFIVFYKDKLKNMKYEKEFRYGVAIFAFVLEISIHIWNIAHNNWHFPHNLPFHLCALSLFFAVYVFITKNEKFFYVVYFWAFGAVLSVLFPDMEFGPDRFRYWQFFIAHMMFMWMNLYMIFVHGFNPTFKHFLRSSLILFLLATGIMLPFNILTGENFWFLMHHGGTPLSIYYPLGPVWYYIITVIVIFIVVLIWYGPVYLYLKKKERI